MESEKSNHIIPMLFSGYASALTSIYTIIVAIVGKQNYKTSSRIVLFKLRDLKSKVMNYVIKEYKNRYKYSWENNFNIAVLIFLNGVLICF